MCSWPSLLGALDAFCFVGASEWKPSWWGGNIRSDSVNVSSLLERRCERKQVFIVCVLNIWMLIADQRQLSYPQTCSKEANFSLFIWPKAVSVLQAHTHCHVLQYMHTSAQRRVFTHQQIVCERQLEELDQRSATLGTRASVGTRRVNWWP